MKGGRRLVASSTLSRQSSDRRQPLLTGLFITTSFIGASLLFLVQPMVARMLLPAAGGSAALWNTALVFFMTTLLLGYVLAHVSTRRLGIRRHPPVQLALLALPLLFLPIALPDGWLLPADGSHALWVLAVLAVMVGIPFLALSTSSPTIQYWFSATGHRQAHDPYFLYAAGNVGAVGALLAYPFLIEPWLTLESQARLWAAGYVVFLLCVAWCAVVARRGSAVEVSAADRPRTRLSAGRRLKWLAWSAVPAALMLGVTRHIATDVASFPLLWIVPLLLYLLTFVIAFGRDSARRDSIVSKAVWIGAIALAMSFYVSASWLPLVVLVHLGWFFAAALLAHGKLAADRPDPAHLTEFYTIISFGGALGGVFGALIAPQIFDVTLEYPIAIGLALVIAIPGSTRPAMLRIPKRYGWAAVGVGAAAALVYTDHFLVLGVVAGIVALLTVGRRATAAVLLAVAVATPIVATSSFNEFQGRSFFGVSSVRDDGGVRTLWSGTTEHGTQVLAADGQPTSYYHEAGPIGQVLTAIDAPIHMAVVGLGAGTLAAYGRPGDRYTFFEIDPLVVDIATSELFTYIGTSEAEVAIEVVDGRLGLLDSAERFDVVVIDAFSSDAIPVHLMTVEAIAVYLDRLAPNGVLLVHVSNRYFDLRPVLGRAAHELAVPAAVQSFRPSAAELSDHAAASTWIAISASEDRFVSIIADGRWEQLPAEGPLWTDDYSNLLGVIDF